MSAQVVPKPVGFRRPVSGRSVIAVIGFGQFRAIPRVNGGSPKLRAGDWWVDRDHILPRLRAAQIVTRSGNRLAPLTFTTDLVRHELRWQNSSSDSSDVHEARCPAAQW